MNSIDEMLNPEHRLQASEGFADKVMERICQQQVVMEAPDSMRKKILGMAAMVLICVTIGISIGLSPGWRWQQQEQKQKLQEFQEVHHLFPDRKESIILFTL